VYRGHKFNNSFQNRNFQINSESHIYIYITWPQKDVCSVVPTAVLVKAITSVRRAVLDASKDASTFISDVELSKRNMFEYLTLKMNTELSFETSGTSLLKLQRHVQEDFNLQSVVGQSSAL
jgi:hypothetical protein